MSSYEDYNPHIIYPEDTDDGDNIASIDDSVSDKSIKEKRNARQRQRREERRARERKVKTKTSPSDSSQWSLRNFFASRTTYVVTGIILAGIAAYFLISFVSYISSCLKDQSIIYNNELGSIPQVSNKGGEGGARLSEWLINRGFGLGAFVVILWLACISMRLLIGKPRFKPLNFTIKCLIGFITLSLIIGIFTIGSNTTINWGGYHGRYVNEWIIGFLGWWGAAILCIVMIAIFVAICMRDVIKWIIAKKRILDAKRREIMEKRAFEKKKERELKAMQQREAEAHRAEIENEQPDSILEQEKEGVSFVNHDNDQSQDNEVLEYVYEDEPEEVAGHGENSEGDTEPSIKENSEKISDIEESNSQASMSAPVDAEDDIKDEKEKRDDAMVVNVNQIAKADRPLDHGRKSQYKFPDIELLVERDEKVTVSTEEQLENKEMIRKTLNDFGFPIVSIEATVGPTVTLYEVRPETGQKVSKIKGLADDIALSLSAIGVRIIAPIPGKGTVGIEVANKKPKTVSMRTLLQSKRYQESKAHLPLALGSTIANEVYIADLASIPHLLVAGATGQGKSVGLNVIITSLLYKKRPDELKFVMFDPKQVEFNLYEAIEKQYLAKLPDEKDAIIVDMKKVVPTLNSLCTEMDDRYSLLKLAQVRKIDEYNALIKKGELDKNEGHRFLPYIVVVVDEYADLIMTAGKDVELPLARLAQKARAVGIHVILATQRPSADIITSKIRSNFPGRIAFKVSSSKDSSIILDAVGANALIGKGDMLINYNSEIMRVQCAFIDTPEVKAVCEHISKQPYPIDSPYLLPEPPQETDGGGGFEGPAGKGNIGELDPLYEEIRRYVITSGTASTSNIQRKYGLGYNRAGRIMDQLEQNGIVGPSHGGKARDVLVDTL